MFEMFEKYNCNNKRGVITFFITQTTTATLTLPGKRNILASTSYDVICILPKDVGPSQPRTN